jgi:putative DNA primase/helicase
VTDAPSTLDAANFYAGLGLRVLPLCPGLKRPVEDEWGDRASTDPSTLAGWFSNGSRYGIGVTSGSKSGVLVLDIDDNGATKHGEDVLADLVAKHGPLPDTPTVHTPSGGRHLYFKYPGYIPIPTVLDPDTRWVEVRRDGHQAVAPPTVCTREAWPADIPIHLRNGGQYVWDAELHPSLVAFAELPPAWLALLPAAVEPVAGDDDFAAILAAAGFTFGRTDNKGCAHWARPGKTLREGTSVTVYPWPDHHATVWSSSVPGVKTSRPYGPDALAKALGVATEDPDEQPVEEGEAAPDKLYLTDMGNAERFINLCKGRVRFVDDWGKWIAYRAGRWSVDSNEALVTEMAKKVSLELMRMIPRGRDKDERRRLLTAGVRAQSAGALSAMVKLARGIAGVIVRHEDLDADAEILNVKNGTVDLRTGELRPHDPPDLCTKQCPVVYDPDATAPLWEQCLERWQPDAEVREYLQREIGAGACGKQTETLSVHHGLGGNGKSKFFEAAGRVTGDYSAGPHKSLLVNTRHEQHATVIATLFRIRLAVAHETGQRDSLSESQVKNLTGNDRLRARRMREDEWSFDPSHTLIMVTNVLPRIEGTDEGIWRRVRLIPWDETIPVAERDEELGAKLRAEDAGILRWIVEGSRRYLADGHLGAPEKVVARTAAFRGDQDTVARFIKEAGLVFDPNSRVASSKIIELHQDWCVDAGVAKHDIGSEWRRLTAELRNRGAKGGGRTKSVRYWTGVTIAGETEESQVKP